MGVSFLKKGARDGREYCKKMNFLPHEENKDKMSIDFPEET
jgi:hypothetical protein